MKHTLFQIIKQLFSQALEGRQVEEAVSSLFHTLLFHRTLGKFHYRQEGSYSVGTVGYQDQDCEFIDLTYVSNFHVNNLKLLSDLIFSVTGAMQLWRNAKDRKS